MSDLPHWMQAVVFLVWIIGVAFGLWTLLGMPHVLDNKLDGLTYRINWLQDIELAADNVPERDKLMDRGDFAKRAIPRRKKVTAIRRGYRA
jgi:hypothetical protein